MASDNTGDDSFGGKVVRLPEVSRREAPRPLEAPPVVTHGSKLVNFDRTELRLILNLYGRQVAAGEWKDYAIDFSTDRAVFAVMRRSNEYPIYRIEKVPALARKQGAYSVVSVTGFILKRGHDLRNVLAVLEPKAKLRQA